MKKGFIVAMMVLYAGLATGCSGRSSDGVEGGVESPGVAPSGSAGVSGGQDAMEETEASQQPDETETPEISEDPGASEGPALTEGSDPSEAIAGGNNKKNSSASGKKTGGQSSAKENKASITMERAKRIALKKAGLQEKDGIWRKEKMDWEDDREVYELEFVSGGVEYDFEIDSETGDILDYDKDYD